MGKKRIKEKKKNKKEKIKKDEKIEENKADFFLDDEDADLAYNSSELEEEEEKEEFSEHGSDLDFNEEDYESSEEEKKTKKKEKFMSREELKKLINKTKNGNSFAINKLLILFNQITNQSNNINFEDNEDNILSKPKLILKLINFCIEEIPNILQLKFNSKDNIIKNDNHSLIKRYLSILVKYLKSSENTMKEFIFNNIDNLSNLIFLYSNFSEIFLKIGLKIWSTTTIEKLRKSILTFVKNLIIKKNQFFELSIKLFYINYLDIAKSMNIQSYNHIKTLQNDIINILQYDLQKSYITIFTFIRKLCIQLRLTIIDKTSSSIKLIYNWQFINSIILWGRVIIKYYNNKDISLLLYPLIQTIIGVIRLNYGEQFYLLRIRLVMLLNHLSKISGIFIPIAMYILPILKSNYFIEKCKIINSPNLEKLKKKKKIKEEDLEKKKIENNEKKINKRINIYVMLKIKPEEYRIKQIRKDLLEEACDCLLEFLSIHSNKIIFEELSYDILKGMRSALKNIYDKEYREIIKNRKEKIEKNIEEIRNKIQNFKGKDLILTEYNTLIDFEKKYIIGDFYKEFDNISHKREANFEALKHQKENKFIEV
jgi:hypothetical protein